ncbi:hypothetical protein PFICI_13099 [Pestalotiopsis fici W106-1]|uniref:PNPLA domain-containing protein n=1 Tax=Pestalotiopsis fici (strain W106-1 / CGMCC3.15140) TaxID=1229662 RepID=W3WL18_PESFW|nr:uncharacterized protein PFICI_13099 [Pestalotiopsis fici W106-1]ETS74615.1 hypothetical protein PFICI_13099 [Pestalotiopsis fici W106-1]
MPPLKVLSLDGGGVRGLAELLILKKIFTAMARIKGNVDPENELLPCDYFDLIGGTSTGGLIALMLGRLKMKISVAIEAFQEISAAAFPTDRKKWKPLKIFIGGAVYDAKAFETQIKKVVTRNQPNEDLELIERSPNPKCRVFVCSTTNYTTSPRLIRSYASDDDHHFPYAPIKVWEAARATSAAPSLFKPMTIKRPGPSMTLYDGALTGNNPIRQVVNECNGFDHGRNFECIVSLGTGVKGATPLKSSNHVLKVAKVLAKHSLDCHAAHVEFLSTREGRGLIDDQRYFRFSPERNLGEVELDGWESFDAITEYIELFAIEKRHEIEKCARRLLGLQIDTNMPPELGIHNSQPSTDRPPVASRPNPNNCRHVSAPPMLSPSQTNPYAERTRLDALKSSTSLPIALSTSAGPGHAITPRHVNNLSGSGSRPTIRRPATTMLSFSAFGDRSHLLTTFDNEDAAKHIVDEIKEAEALLERGSLTQAYHKFRESLTLVYNSPIPERLKLTCHIHLGIAECRMLAPDGKTKEKKKALAYLESAKQHALQALDLKHEASQPAARMSLLAIAIKKAEIEAEQPDMMDPAQVATLYGQVVEQIDLLQERINRESGTEQARDYKPLLTRAEEWRKRLKLLGPD